jgi:mRNA interferase MazF
MGASICWAAYEADTQFTLFDLSALKKQCLISNPTIGSEIKKVRPVVIISQDDMNKYLETVVVCPLTSKVHPQWRTRLQIKCANKRAEIAVDRVRTISKQRLKKKIDTLSKSEGAQLRKLITDMYGE